MKIMTEKELYQLRFPIGIFESPKVITKEDIQKWIKIIEKFPSKIQEITQDVGVQEINWKYRPNGWTIKQVVHHCSDSHINALIRFKLALTEDTPTIKPYPEHLWAELIDSQNDNLNDSILILQGVHHKLVQILKNLKKEELKKEFIHPEYNRRYSLEENIGVYAWHCEHHLAHIQQALNAQGKYI